MPEVRLQPCVIPFGYYTVQYYLPRLYFLPHTLNVVFSVHTVYSLSVLFCCHQWVTIGHFYWFSAVSREESRPHIELSLDKWDYQSALSIVEVYGIHCLTQKEWLEMGSETKEKSEVLLICNIHKQLWGHILEWCSDFISLPCTLSPWRQAWKGWKQAEMSSQELIFYTNRNSYSCKNAKSSTCS